MRGQDGSLKNVRPEIVLQEGLTHSPRPESFHWLSSFAVTFGKPLNFQYLNYFSHAVIVFVFAMWLCRNLKPSSKQHNSGLASWVVLRRVQVMWQKHWEFINGFLSFLRFPWIFFSVSWSKLRIVWDPRKLHCLFEPTRSYHYILS